MDPHFVILLMISIAWFGITFVYFIRYLRRNTEYKIGSINLIVSFLVDIKNIKRFYSTFIEAHQSNKYGKRLTYFLVFTNILAYISFPIIAIVAAILNS